VRVVTAYDPAWMKLFETEWKLAHVADDQSDGAYTASKWPFVARVLANAGIKLKPDEERLARR
jgi:hypothetical protein